MSMQQTSKSAVVISKSLGILSSILGYFLALIGGFPLILGTLKDSGSVILALIFVAIGTLLIIHGIKTKKRINRFKRYVNILSLENETSLERIASTSSQSVDFVTKDLELMIKRKFFINVYIDKNTNEIILGNRKSQASNDTMKKSEVTEPKELKAVTCKNCGASNNITIGEVSECEFCGSIINS